MRNYFRAIRQSFQHRLGLTASCLFCALMIGILWGGNIAVVVYPITEICLKKDTTFSTWLALKIEENNQKIKDSEEKIARLGRQTAAEERQTAIASEQQRLWWNRQYGEWYQRIQPMIEKYTPSRPFQTVVFLMGVVLAGTILRVFFLVTHTILAASIAQGTAREIRKEFYQKTLDYEANYFSKEGIAHVMSRFTNDMTVLTNGIAAIYGKIIREPLKLIVCLTIAAYISWQLLLVSMLLIPIAGCAIRWLARSIKRVVRRSLEEIANLYARLAETFQSIRIVKAFTRESYEQHKFSEVNDLCYHRAMKIAKYEAFVNPTVEVFGILMVGMAILAGTYLVMESRTDICGIPMLFEPIDMNWLLLFFAMMAGASDPARRLSDIFTQFQSAAAAADRIYTMIDRSVSIRDPQHPIPMPPHRESIRFDHVSFEYDPARPVLKDISLDIPFGECIAFLGASGCGKSTLLNLIPRFTDANGGKVSIDGLPVTSVLLKDLRQQIGLVTQEPVLFNESVLENIRYGRAGASWEEVIAAAKQAFAHDFIEKELPGGYETIVNPGGGNLSGGQRQRIALARAILRDPPIFLLDEATSQIDIQSERMIHEALSTFKKGRTTLMITHRLSALELADRIVLMSEGTILAAGTHEELMQSSPEYVLMRGEKISAEPQP